MSNQPKTKEHTQVSNVFSITDKDFAETGVPGVTRLINPEVAKMKAGGKAPAAPKLTAVENTPAPAAPSAVEASGTLAEMGVDLELEFRMDRGEFRFSKFKNHAKTAAEPWQSDLFSKMILNFKSLGIETSFQEFSAQQNEFQKEAFGLDETMFVQIVRSNSDQNIISVLLSRKSLIGLQDAVRSILEKPAEKSDFKIELAS